MTTPTLGAIKRHADAHGFTHPSTGVRLGAWLVSIEDGVRPPIVMHLGVTEHAFADNEGLLWPTGSLVATTAWDGELVWWNLDSCMSDRRWSALTLSGDLARPGGAADEDVCVWCAGAGVAPR